MEIIDTIASFIASNWWASLVLLVLYIGYEIAIRKMPTSSPYYSVVEILGQFFKMLGKIVIKIIGENMSKEIETDKKGNEVTDKKTSKPVRKPFKDLKNRLTK